MASGKKNYFRHSFFARNDLKLKMLRDRVGVGFYFYYFSLLEQCGEASSEELKEFYVFHDSTIRNLWCINLKKSERVAIEMMSVGLLEFKKAQNTFEFTIPNLSKYLGKYDSKLISNAPNKRKEKEIKEKEIETPSALSVVSDTENKKPRKKNLPKAQPQDLSKSKDSPELFAIEAPQLDEELSISDKASNALTMLNSICFKSFRPVAGNMKFINARLKEGYTLQDFKKVIDYKQGQWGNDPKMSVYLRPETIFGTKFDSYLAEASDQRLVDLEEIKLVQSLFPGYSA